MIPAASVPTPTTGRAALPQESQLIEDAAHVLHLLSLNGEDHDRRHRHRAPGRRNAHERSGVRAAQRETRDHAWRRLDHLIDRVKEIRKAGIEGAAEVGMSGRIHRWKADEIGAVPRDEIGGQRPLEVVLPSKKRCSSEASAVIEISSAWS
jgi:hypothetical protein